MIPKDIGKLINLQKFVCFNNKITEIPIEIINCIHLREFIFHSNEINNLNPIIQNFIGIMHNINNHGMFNDNQNNTYIIYTTVC